MTQSNALRFLSFLVVASAYQSSAFVPATPLSTSSRTTSLSPLSVKVGRRRQPRPLFVVADAPNREEEKTNRGRGKDNEDTENDSSWIATSSGGFLPKLPRLFGGNKKTNNESHVKEPAVTPRRKTSGKPEEVLTIQEYKAVVADEKDVIVCVRFYAPWCKACKACEQPFRKLCREYPSVKFVEVPLTKDNAFLHDGLGVPSLPYGHIYHPQAGLVEERKINLKKKEFATFEQILETYIDGECRVEYVQDEETGNLICQQASLSN